MIVVRGVEITDEVKPGHPDWPKVAVYIQESLPLFTIKEITDAFSRDGSPAYVEARRRWVQAWRKHNGERS